MQKVIFLDFHFWLVIEIDSEDYKMKLFHYLKSLIFEGFLLLRRTYTENDSRIGPGLRESSRGSAIVSRSILAI